MDPGVIIISGRIHLDLHKGAAQSSRKCERCGRAGDARHIGDDRDLLHVVPHAGVIADSDAELGQPSILPRDYYDTGQI